MSGNGHSEAAKIRGRPGGLLVLGEANPDFFKGTVVERQAREVLGTLSRAAS
jgi:hypothetical protein